MSFFSINARAPIIQQASNSFHERLETVDEQYSITVQRGFNTAGFVLKGSPDYLVDWYMNGLARDVTWLGPDSFLSWRGLVTRLSLDIGGWTRTRSMESMADRIVLVYTPLSTGSNPPQAGAQAVITVDDIALQNQFGIKTAVISGGEKTSTAAAVKAISDLNKLAKIQVGETQTVARSEGPTLRVEMSGYATLFDWYVYNEANSGTVNASTQLVAVAAADPNGILIDSSGIEANTTQVERYWQNQPAWKVIEAVTGIGRDVAGVGEPWVSGVYGTRLIYKAAEGLDSQGNPKSSNVHSRLYRKVVDTREIYTDEGGAEVPYWYLRPDRLVYTEGIPGEPMYVEQVTFAPPVTINLGGRDAQRPLAGNIRV
jgi:hypothetical protein